MKGSPLKQNKLHNLGLRLCRKPVLFYNHAYTIFSEKALRFLENKIIISIIWPAVFLKLHHTNTTMDS